MILLAEQKDEKGQVIGQAILFKNWLRNLAVPLTSLNNDEKKSASTTDTVLTKSQLALKNLFSPTTILEKIDEKKDGSKNSTDEKESASTALLASCKKLETKVYPFGLKQNRAMWACGDKGTFHGFRGVNIDIHEWTPEIKQVREKLDTEFGIYTNFCLLNHYRDGSDSIAPHADGELFAEKKSVFTLSLGGTRKMNLVSATAKNKNGNIVFDLDHGDLFWMWGNIQDYWKHGIDAVSPASSILPRWSLTFRSTLLKKCSQNKKLL